MTRNWRGLHRIRGTTAKEYQATGAVSEKDILGRNRISGRRVDIGALETPNACSYILLK